MFSALGIEGWKPWFAVLVLPPVPFLLMAVLGARLMFWRRAAGWLLILGACAGLWLSATAGAADWLAGRLLPRVRALDIDQQQRAHQDLLRKRQAAVVVLGGGREAYAPEYAMANLGPTSQQRLRYGLWLGKQLGVPVGFSGGVGHAGAPGAAEAEVAARIAASEFARPLRWTEAQSRDTRENAAHSVSMLRADGVRIVYVVTHAWHMPRALRAFRDAAQRNGAAMEIVAAPMGMAEHAEQPWLPSGEGLVMVRRVLREVAAKLAGA